MNTGEDVQSLRKIIDLSRLISLSLLSIHDYLRCYSAFRNWGWTSIFIDRLLFPLAGLPLFSQEWMLKLIVLFFLAVSLLGMKGRKDQPGRLSEAIAAILIGLILFGSAGLSFYFFDQESLKALSYISLGFSGYLLILWGGTLMSRIIAKRMGGDVFNLENETFPQEERLLENAYSINLPARYASKNAVRKSWINIINPFRGLLVAGTPGAGKSYFVIRHIIDQHIRKGFSMFLYDFKYDDLSKIAYNKLLRYQKNYNREPAFYVINFDDLNYSNRCNPLDPAGMDDITDATEASRTIMLGLNRDWIKKQGDFFVESPINFLTAIIWYLRKYRDGRYCTLPHVIELMQADYEPLFSLLQQEEEIKVLINPFVSAFQNNAKEQLEGQIASAKIGLARLSSPQLYFVLSGNDFSLDVNNPEEPKIVCVGNNPQKLQVYGAVLSLYISRMIKLVNRRGQLKSSLIFDEFPTIYFSGIDSLIATARSNQVATTLAVQDFSQLKKDYGAEQADVITGIIGNIISGQVSGDTARKLSESFGRIMQPRESISINSSDTSTTHNTQLDQAIPASKITMLSSGEFVGIVADTPDEKIRLKMFHAEIINDHAALKAEEKNNKPIPPVRQISPEDIQENYQRIKMDIARLLSSAADADVPRKKS